MPFTKELLATIYYLNTFKGKEFFTSKEIAKLFNTSLVIASANLVRFRHLGYLNREKKEPQKRGRPSFRYYLTKKGLSRGEWLWLHADKYGLDVDGLLLAEKGI